MWQGSSQRQLVAEPWRPRIITSCLSWWIRWPQILPTPATWWRCERPQVFAFGSSAITARVHTKPSKLTTSLRSWLRWRQGLLWAFCHHFRQASCADSTLDSKPVFTNEISVNPLFVARSFMFSGPGFHGWCSRGAVVRQSSQCDSFALQIGSCCAPDGGNEEIWELHNLQSMMIMMCSTGKPFGETLIGWYIYIYTYIYYLAILESYAKKESWKSLSVSVRYEEWEGTIRWYSPCVRFFLWVQYIRTIRAYSAYSRHVQCVQSARTVLTSCVYVCVCVPCVRYAHAVRTIGIFCVHQLLYYIKCTQPQYTEGPPAVNAVFLQHKWHEDLSTHIRQLLFYVH